MGSVSGGSGRRLLVSLAAGVRAEVMRAGLVAGRARARRQHEGAAHRITHHQLAPCRRRRRARPRGRRRRPLRDAGEEAADGPPHEEQEERPDQEASEHAGPLLGAAAGFGVSVAAGVPGGGIAVPPGCAAWRFASARWAALGLLAVRVELDHLLPRGGRAGQILLAVGLHDAQVQQGLGVLRVERSESSNCADGAIGLVGVVVADAQIGADVDVPAVRASAPPRTTGWPPGSARRRSTCSPAHARLDVGRVFSAMFRRAVAWASSIAGFAGGRRRLRRRLGRRRAGGGGMRPDAMLRPENPADNEPEKDPGCDVDNDYRFHRS